MNSSNYIYNTRIKKLNQYKLIVFKILLKIDTNVRFYN